MSKKPRTKTKSGKPLLKSGKIAVPTVKRGDDGKMVATSAEERNAARRTELPTADRNKMGVPEQPQKSVQRVSAVRGVGTPAKGAAGSYGVIRGLVEQARMHLNNMQATHGTPEFHQHHESFNQVHATLAIGAPDIHTSLKYARDFVANPGENSQKHLALAHKAIDDRLSIYKDTSESNIENSQAGYQERMRKIRAERNPS
jgi:hypothetical protein